jgi:hypothetical protein
MFDIGEGLGGFIKAIGVILCISVPLGIWKIVEIIIWVGEKL